MAAIIDRWVKSRTICWTCARAYGGCSWSRTFTPVAGWEAEHRSLKNNNAGKWVTVLDSYTVKECPLYIEDRMEATP